MMRLNNRKYRPTYDRVRVFYSCSRCYRVGEDCYLHIPRHCRRCGGLLYLRIWPKDPTKPSYWMLGRRRLKPGEEPKIP